MATLGSRLWAPLGLLVLAMFFISQANAEYDEDLCKKYTKDGFKPLKSTPYFYDNFFAVTEETVYSKDGSTQGRVVQRTIRYSPSTKQLDIHEKKANNRIYIYVDQEKNSCVHYDRKTSGCETMKGTCSKVQKLEKDFLQLNNKGMISLTSSSAKLWWPTDKNMIKLKVYKEEESEVRNLKTKKYVTCVYDKGEDLTTVTEWQVLDVDKYPKMDVTKNTVLMAHYHQSKNKSPMESRRIDFFEYRQLSADELQYGLHIPEDICQLNFIGPSSTKIPHLPLRFRYLEEVDVAVKSDLSQYERYVQEIEYNAMSQVLKATTYHARDDDNEKEVSYRYTDYSTKHTYFASETTGNCSVLIGNEYTEDMQSASEIWGLENAQGGYVLEHRGIPCQIFHSFGGKSTASTLYVATSEWLKNQGRDEKEFYPVFLSKYEYAGKGSSSAEIYEFKINPGYHFPFLRRCFDEDTNIDASFVLLVNYKASVEDNLTGFKYEMRTLLKNITGIRSSVRLQSFYFEPEEGHSDQTRFYFTVLGNAKDIDRSNAAYYDTDPVTSNEAMGEIEKAVDSGKMAFELENKQISVKFHKGSFKHYNHGFLDRQVAGSGHSSGAMAGVGIAMIAVGLLLGVGIMLVYKRYSQGSLPALSFTFGKEGVNS
ncbi:hypothetical protein ElyMa_000773800 [Elysia marginata]|uniref:DUF7959 domain-containing protein n=1 Tax=Elysia marginata TaxID=1093978 RepID=A0AAV4GTC6_9GAST|nr:hypothetical protein ElyMa_000773800 [Elysia marginata]